MRSSTSLSIEQWTSKWVWPPDPPIRPQCRGRGEETAFLFHTRAGLFIISPVFYNPEKITGKGNIITTSSSLSICWIMTFWKYLWKMTEKSWCSILPSFEGQFILVNIYLFGSIVIIGFWQYKGTCSEEVLHVYHYGGFRNKIIELELCIVLPIYLHECGDRGVSFLNGNFRSYILGSGEWRGSLRVVFYRSFCTTNIISHPASLYNSNWKLTFV